MSRIAFNWQQTSSLDTVSRRHMVMRDENHKVQMEITVPKRKSKGGRPKVRYYLDEDPIEYRSEEDLTKAVNKAKQTADGYN